MKKTFLLIGFLFIVLFSASCGLLPVRELFVIHIHGDWCSGCKKVDPVIHSLESYFSKKKRIQYLVFDQTSPETVKQSEKLAEKFGLEDLFEYERHTGEVVYVDKKTKELLAVLSDAEDKKEYIKIAENLLYGRGAKSKSKRPKNYRISKRPLHELETTRLYVINIHHDKCSTCEITTPAFELVADLYKDNSDVGFFTFNLSTSNTIDEARSDASYLGISEVYNSYKHTGEVIFVDPIAKKVFASLVSETDASKYDQIINRYLN